METALSRHGLIVGCRRKRQQDTRARVGRNRHCATDSGYHTRGPDYPAWQVGASTGVCKADDDLIAAQLRGHELRQPYEGAGSCYIEFGGGLVGKVEANFFGGPTPTARLVGPSRKLAADKVAFASTRRERWFEK